MLSKITTNIKFKKIGNSHIIYYIIKSSIINRLNLIEQFL